MDIYSVDFETHYSREFSLSKMTTEAYVRSPLFEVIGMGIKKNDGPSKWVPKPLVKPFLDTMRPVLEKAAILCHNTAFDGAILSWHYDIKPALWLDTLSMARPIHNVNVGGSLKSLVAYYNLGAKGTEVVNAIGKRYADFSPSELTAYGSYCINDTELTYALYHKLKPQIPTHELLVIDQTIRMYTEPTIELDVDALRVHLANVEENRAALLRELADAMGQGADVDLTTVQTTLMSNNNFATLLTALGVDPPMKVSPTTGKETFAFSKTDKGLTDLLEHPDDRVRVAVEARLGTKSSIERTRTEAFIGISQRGSLPIMLNYYGAHTGRFSGGDKVNLQNLPSRGNVTLRRALKAPKGHSLLACDSSQIEARTVAWLAGQNDLLASFSAGNDVYCEFASEIYGRTITKADTKERFVGKTGILGLGYGCGWAKFKEMLRVQAKVIIDDNEAQRIVAIYRQKYHMIARLWVLCNSALGTMLNGGSGDINGILKYDADGFYLPNGMRLGYMGLRQSRNGYEYINDARSYRKMVEMRLRGEKVDDLPWTKIYGGKVVENLVQALAGIAVREQMVKIKLAGYHVAFQVHDENVMVVPDDQLPVATQRIERIMSTAPKWAPSLPVACESGSAKNYGDC